MERLLLPAARTASCASGTARTANSLLLFLRPLPDRKSTRLNSSHGYISYAVFCLKKKNIYNLLTQLDRITPERSSQFRPTVSQMQITTHPSSETHHTHSAPCGR